MGSVYRTCEDCGESLDARWNWDVDDEDDETPFVLRLKLIEHRRECPGREAAKYRAAFAYLQTRVPHYPVLGVLLEEAMKAPE